MQGRLISCWSLLCCLLLAAGCGEANDRDTLSRSRFVEINVALRYALDQPGDTVGRRAEVLRRFGVSAEDLQTWIAARRGRTEELAEIWEEIQRSLKAQDTIARDSVIPADTASAAAGKPRPVSDSVAAPDSTGGERPSAVPLLQVPPAELPAQRRKEGLPREPD